MRLQSLLRSAERVPEVVVKGPLTLRLTPMAAYLNSVNMKLTQKDFSLLLLFVKNEDRVMGAEYLYEQVWGQPMNNNNQAVRSAISRLRGKLKETQYGIESEYGGGYRFSLLSSNPPPG